MKIAFRNFVQTLRRYKTASLLNVIGLTLAFTAFYIILVQVWWEMGYNRSLPDAERIYLVESESWFEPGQWSATLNRPVPERVIPSTPGVEVGGSMWGGFGEEVIWTSNVQTMGYNKLSAYDGLVSLSFLDVFGFRAVEGNLADLKKKNAVLLSRKTAARLGVGVGDMLWVGGSEPKPEAAHEVVAVFDDFPANSLLGRCEVVRDLGDQSLNDGSEWSFNYFVKLHPGADPAAFSKRWIEVIRELQQAAAERAKAAGEEFEEGTIWGVRLSPVGDLYFESDSQVPCEQGSRATTYTLLGIALLVIVLAFINFVNFFLALVPVRLRTVNTFKVFGAPASSLRFNFVFEALGLVVISLLAAWYIAFVLRGSEFASYINASLALDQNYPVVAIMLGVAVGMTFAASLYPAWYITSFAPAMVVKGSFSGTRSGRCLRTLLLGVQFFIASGLISATGFIQLQHSYMMNYDMGFDKEDLLAVRISGKTAQSYEALRGKLLSDTRIEEVTGASSSLVSVGRMGWGRMFKQKHVNFECYVVQSNFLKAMGIPVTVGRDFLPGDRQVETGTLIFNEAARGEFEMQPGDFITGFNGEAPIVGFCANFNFKPLQYDVVPFAFYLIPDKMIAEGWHRPTTLYVRIAPGVVFSDVADFVRASILSFDPQLLPGDIAIHSFDEELGRQYEQEHRLTVIVGAFSLLAVVIALMGVFGIVLFEVQYRRREIAVRKVMGASTHEILAMFNRRYIRLVLVCFALSVPVCSWAVSRWLSTFAYRIPLIWWVFALALAAVAAVTVLTVTVCVWRTANENPANSVKME